MGIIKKVLEEDRFGGRGGGAPAGGYGGGGGGYGGGGYGGGGYGGAPASGGYGGGGAWGGSAGRDCRAGRAAARPSSLPSDVSSALPIRAAHCRSSAAHLTPPAPPFYQPCCRL